MAVLVRNVHAMSLLRWRHEIDGGTNILKQRLLSQGKQ